MSDFLDAIWCGGPHSFCWQRDGFSYRVVDHPDEVLALAVEHEAAEVWIGAHPLTGNQARRGCAEDVARVGAIPADLDWSHPTRKAEKALPSEAEVRARLAQLGPELAPSIVVHSGHGLQPWWLLDAPVDVETGARLIGGITALLESVGLENGRPDLPAIMRLPGTTNWKDPDEPVRVVIESGDTTRRLVPEYLFERLPAAAPVRTRVGTAHRGNGTVTDEQAALLDYVTEHHGGRLVRTLSSGELYVARPGKREGHSGSIIVGDEGDALLVVYSSSWGGIGPVNGQAYRPWVLGRYGLRHPDDRVSDFVAPPAVEPVVAVQQPERSSFDRVDLRPALTGDAIVIVADCLTMRDGRALLHKGRLNGIHGESGGGKTWLADLLAAQLVAQGEALMLVDMEDNERPTVARLRQLGVPDEAIAERVVFISPDEPFTEANVGRLIDQARELTVTHVVLDSLGEAFALDGTNENHDAEVTPWLRDVCRRIIRQTGAGVTLIDHGTKAADRPLDPAGSKRKRAAITGTSWLLTSPQPFTKAAGGVAELTCAKDRHGQYRRNQLVARLVMSPLDIATGRSTLALEPVAPVDTATTKRLDLLAVVVNICEARPTAVWSLRALRDEARALGHSFGNPALEDAAERAVVRGHLAHTRGYNGAKAYRFMRALPSAVDPFIGRHLPDATADASAGSGLEDGR